MQRKTNREAAILEIKAERPGELDLVVGRHYLYKHCKNTCVIEKIQRDGKMSYIYARHLTGLNKGKEYSASIETWKALTRLGSIVTHPFL